MCRWRNTVCLRIASFLNMEGGNIALVRPIWCIRHPIARDLMDEKAYFNGEDVRLDGGIARVLKVFDNIFPKIFGIFPEMLGAGFA